MATYFCINCWNEIVDDQAVCSHCQASQADLCRESYIAKLIRALGNPEPETPIRAAYILGKLKAQEAIPALLLVLRQNQDFYVTAAAIEALGAIGDTGMIAVIQGLLTQPQPLPVRFAVEDAVQRLSSGQPDDAR